MDDKEQPALADTWLTRLKNNPVVAILIVIAAILAGIVSLKENFSKLIDNPQPQIVATVPPAAAPAVRRVYFRTRFTLKRDDAFVDHGVTVRTGGGIFGVPEKEGTNLFGPLDQSVLFGANADGPVEAMNVVRGGEEVRLTRKDCDSLVVLVMSVLLLLPTSTTFEDVQKWDPGVQLALVDRRVTGEISGHCEE
jgi:hypothetical protein